MRGASLADVLAESSRLGYLGGSGVDAHMEHGLRFLAALPPATTSVLDLGSGGGVPGLVLAVERPDWQFVLLDRRSQRTDFLRRAVGRLDLENVTVVVGEASIVAHEPMHRARYDAVVARSFGPPAITAEAGAGFVRLGGVLVASEPPGADAGRWPTEPLRQLGLLLEEDLRIEGFRRLRAVSPCPDIYPRRRLRPLLF